MRFKVASVFWILLLVGSNDARPSKVANPIVAEEETMVAVDDDSSRRSSEPTISSSVGKSDSRIEPPSDQRKLKNLQYMDQSLRTVATQLLNVTNPDEIKDNKNRIKFSKEEMPTNLLLVRKQETKTKNVSNGNHPNFESNTKSDMELVKEINKEISSVESMGIGFGRPMNSKFGYFESSHPGEAMALTEEELERELMSSSSSTRLMNAYKNNPTTTGGISTWILLNPPTTTSKPSKNQNNNDDKEINVEVRFQTKLTTPVHVYESTLKTDMKTVTNTVKTVPLQSTTTMEKLTTITTKSATPILKKTTLTPRLTTTTEKPVKPTRSTTKTNKTKTSQTVILKSSVSTSPITEAIVNDTTTTTIKPPTTTKKIILSSRPTTKPKITMLKSTIVTSKPMTTKLGRPNQSGKPKTTPTRRVTTKSTPEILKNGGNTSKIEKVTFKPVQMITTPKSLVESVERPMFVTKIMTSVITDLNSKTTAASQSVTSSSVLNTEEIKTNFSDNGLVEISMKPKPQATKTNNVLKVQLKKPTDSPTKIEIEPIKVNAPVLRIEKIEEKKDKTKKDGNKQSDSVVLDKSRIDLKFDFNPELTRIDVKQPSTVTASSPTTTKRPHKRKKNKIRRRKPTTSIATTVATSAITSASNTMNPTTIATSTDIEENLTELGIADNSIQESKVVPESKVSTNNTKNKKKQVQKPIGTQIYNFLSREVMPSFGMMSLVGLGLGLASYFLYPFGGAIARRNYVVEPNYKYNLDEYGGNYGQNEEEVFSKVLQGMTNNDGKYGGIKDYENNFYRYQQFDGAYTDPQTTRKGDPRYPTSSATIYRPIETTVYDTKYRNTEFQYPDIPTTPNYYDGQKQPDIVTNNHGNGDRQFVVGNVPKGYEDKGSNKLSASTETSKIDFDRETALNYKYSKNPVNISPSFGHVEAQALKANQGYDEIEITPTAVAVEHGPRSLRSYLPRSRRRRDSVIQLIPSRSEIEKEEQEIEKEEPLSNEILDIIDSVIPGEITNGKDAKTHFNQENKHQFEKKAVEKGADEKIGNVAKKDVIGEDITDTPVKMTTAAAIQAKATTQISEISTWIADASTSSTSTTTTTVPSLSIDELSHTTAKSDGKEPEDSSVEWFDSATTEKPHEEGYNVFNFIKKIAEIKFRLGLTILKHASEGLARYLGHVQKRINGEE